MKLKFTQFSIVCIFLNLLVIHSTAAPTTTGDREKTGEKKSARSHSRNNTSVKIYPDALKRVMHVVAKQEEDKEIDFFVFDLEGTLMKHFKMVSGDHEKITGLNRGRYVYRVFTGDEETASGEMEMR